MPATLGSGFLSADSDQGSSVRTRIRVPQCGLGSGFLSADSDQGAARCPRPPMSRRSPERRAPRRGSPPPRGIGNRPGRPCAAPRLAWGPLSLHLAEAVRLRLTEVTSVSLTEAATRGSTAGFRRHGGGGGPRPIRCSTAGFEGRFWPQRPAEFQPAASRLSARYSWLVDH